jgi:hypothetical protein
MQVSFQTVRCQAEGVLGKQVSLLAIRLQAYWLGNPPPLRRIHASRATAPSRLQTSANNLSYIPAFLLEACLQASTKLALQKEAPTIGHFHTERLGKVTCKQACKLTCFIRVSNKVVARKIYWSVLQ